ELAGGGNARQKVETGEKVERRSTRIRRARFVSRGVLGRGEVRHTFTMFTAFRKIQLVSLALLQLVNQVCTTPYLVDSNKKCRNSSTEYLHEPLNLCCSKCPPGYRLSKKCTATSDTECKKCQEGTFSSKMSFANCFLCLKCKKDSGLQYAQNCTATSN
ncbi:hypothetical protein Z043_112743, partial [Scleropages formosus]